jgi:HdeA/HdeB family protein
MQLMGNIFKQSRKAAIAAVLLLAGLAAAGGQEQRNRNVGQYLCRDVMRDSGTNRDVAIAFLHGYLLARSGSTDFNLDDLHTQTEAFIELCLSNPDQKAVEAMAAVKKKP